MPNNTNNSALSNKSSVWCNNKNIGKFTSRSSTGSTQMTFGDFNPSGTAPFDEDIAVLDYAKTLI